MTTTLAKWLVAAALLVLAIVPAAAGTPTARLSSVLGDDRRFVLDTVPKNGWMVRQTVEMIELRFPGYVAEITLPTAVRPPLEDLSTETKDGDTFVRFTISCDCSLTVSVRGDRALAIDLVETAAGNRPPAPDHAPLPAPRIRAGADVPLPDKTTKGEIDIAEARKSMIKQLVRAAEAGLIELDDETVPVTDAETVAEDDANESAEQRAGAGTTRTPEPEGGKLPDPKAREKPAHGPSGREGEPPKTDATEKDRAAAEATLPATSKTAVAGVDEEAATSSRPVAACHAAAAFELPRPKSATEWVERIGQLRTSLIGEFDRTNLGAVLDFGRMYLSAGLADEALAVFSEFGNGDAKAVLLAEVAMVVADRALPDNASVLRADCLGPQALWRALALDNRGDHEAAMVAEQAAGRALERLPPILRRDIAARLGLAAANAGEWESARRLHALAGRTGRDHTDTAGWPHLLAARIAQWKGDEAATIRALTRARSADPEVAAAATLMLAEAVLRSGRTKRDGMARLITDLGLLARLNRGTAVGIRAAVLEVHLTDIIRGRASAIDLLTLGLALRDFTEEEFTDTLSAMAKGDEAAERYTIAAMYLDDPAVFDPALSDPDFRAVLARSLIGLGLPAQAANLYPSGQMPVGVAVGLAQGYLDVGDHRSAIALIADLPESPDRDRLHQAAMDASGNAGTGDAIAKPGDGDGEAGSARLFTLARTAIAAGDLQRALDLTMQRLERDGDTGAAETAAMIALALGKSEIPERAAARLKQSNADLHARIAALFAIPRTAVDPADPTSTAAFLQRLDAEIAVIEDALNDG